MEPVQSTNRSEALGVARSEIQPNDDSPATLPAILRLPRELRDLIYVHYVQVDGGYIHNFETNRLLQANGSPISTALALTCRQIAAELRGLALGQNTITFYTHFSESTRQQAGLLHGAMYTIRHRKKMLLRHLIPRLLSNDMVQTAIDAYPQFAHIFDDWTPHRGISALYKDDFDCGEAPSVWEDFINYVFKMLSEHPACHKEAESMPYFWTEEAPCNVLALNEASPEPWLIPTSTEVSSLASIVQVEPGTLVCAPALEYRYSAASVALRFLHAIPSSCRDEVRNVVLHEGCESIANAASHGRGFISLCRSNHRLHVQRIVDIWSTVFRARPDSQADYILRSESRRGNDTMEDDRLFSSTITKAVGAWIAEAQALLSLGMPQKSFSMLLDGNPTPEHTSTVFRIVQRDVAWQSALDAVYERGLLPTPTWYERRKNVGYQYEGLPAAMRNMSTAGAGGPISCNFDVGQPDEEETLLALHRGWTPKQWADNWGMHQPQSFQTEHPLPPWHELKWLRVMM